MGKRSSAATIVDAAKKAKKTTAQRDPDAPLVAIRDYSKVVEKDLCKVAKEGLLKDDAEEVRVLGPESTRTPPAGFQVMILVFILRGLSFPAHDFLRGLLFAYGVQMHDLTPTPYCPSCASSRCATASWGLSPTGRCGNGPST
jgi:hypothetical protein